jgi:predicted dinucleotide-binding enzyme
VEGKVSSQPLDVFLAGGDQDAKRVVGGLVTDGGLSAASQARVVAPRPRR